MSSPAALLARTTPAGLAQPWSACRQAVPRHLPDAVHRGPAVELAPGRGLVTVPGLVRYLVPAGRPVRVAVSADCDADDVACFLAGPVRALDLLLHGVHTLRASAVRIGDRAVVVCGPSAAGKSVLAAALAGRGHPVLADAVCPIVVRDGSADVWPTTAALQLWPPAARRLGLGSVPASVVRPRLAKRAWTFSGGTDAGVPIGGVVVLWIDQRTDAVVGTPLSTGSAKLAVLSRGQWHPRLPAFAGGLLAHFDWLSGLAAAVPILSVGRPLTAWSAPELAGLIEGFMS